MWLLFKNSSFCLWVKIAYLTINNNLIVLVQLSWLNIVLNTQLIFQFSYVLKKLAILFTANFH